MSEQADKPLHNWVRQSLDSYRPDYDPNDWARMQRLLRHRRWWWGGFISGTILLLTGLLSWLILDTQPAKSLKTNQWAASPRRMLPTMTSPHDHTAAGHSSIVTSPKLALIVPKTDLTNQPPLPVALPAPILPIGELKPLISTLTEHIHHPERVAFSPEETAITQQMLTGEFGTDSTSYRIIDRNVSHWANAVLVCDLTTSMYPYTTQLFAWIKQHAGNPALKGMVFFTDCDSLGQQTVAGGPPGRMYVSRERTAEHVLPILIEAARNTVHNHDDAENSVEALLFAQQTFPEAKHFILLADNISTVKDMALLNQVRKPVHVVLCGTTGGHMDLAFQPDYYQIASQTRGSLHTIEDDLNPSEISSKTTLRVGTNYYRYDARKQRFRRTEFDHRPKRFLGFIWL